MSGSALSAWLERLERRSPEARIELGLERVAAVLNALQLAPFGAPVITVAGTNGKGSTVAFIEAICRAAGHRTLAFTSPHLVNFAERIRIDGEPASDPLIAAALDQVEQARGDTFLTYFEHITLAALVVAQTTRPDVLVLEVGLGGRLDAVNVIDPDVAVITSIGLDHVDWLGPTRLAIGREKAGIARPGRPLILGEKRLPNGLAEHLAVQGVETLRAGRDFRWRQDKKLWRLRTPRARRCLPHPAMAGHWQFGNAACAVMALDCLAPHLAVNDAAIRQGLLTAQVPGRLQRVGQAPEILLDVAHNPAAARALAVSLGHPADGRIAVFAALADKDARGIARALDGCFDHWVLATLGGDRGRSADALAVQLAAAAVTGTVETVESVPAALVRAQNRAGPEGRIVVFGSFRTVAEACSALDLLK